MLHHKTKQKIERSILRQSDKGVEISLDNYGYPGKGLTAYQNYLGGGMSGRILNSCNAPNFAKDLKLQKVAEDLKKYFFLSRFPEGTVKDFLFLQNLPARAY